MTPAQKNDDGPRRSLLEAQQAVFKAMTQEMKSFERLEQQAAEDRNWQLAATFRVKRQNYDEALGSVMLGLRQAFEEPPPQTDLQGPGVSS
jgi:hypothetical protein